MVQSRKALRHRHTKPKIYAAILSIFLAAAGLSAGCASNSYAGIPLNAGAADPEIQALARRARGGDKQAQLELGIRYEEGRGLPVDLGRAERLYRAAASAVGGATYVYSPPVGERAGEVVEVSRESRRAGLVEAETRLARLLAGRGHDDAASSGPGRVAPGRAPTTDNAVAVELWRSVESLASRPNPDDVREVLRNSIAALEGSAWRSRRSTLSCPEGPTGAGFPLTRAACGTRSGELDLYHFWDEELAPGGATQLTSARPGCLTAGEAMGMLLRNWRPNFYHSSPPIVADPRSPNTYIETRGSDNLAGQVVYRSQSGLLIHIDHYAHTSCFSNFYIVIP